MEHLYPQIQVKTKKKKRKKGLHQKGTLFSSELKWTPTLRCTPESNYWEECRCAPYSTQTTGGNSEIIEEDIFLSSPPPPPPPPPPPGFGRPVGNERLLVAYC